MTDCLEAPEGTPAPRYGCSCRACYYERRDNVPKWLWDMAGSLGADPWKISTAAMLADRAIQTYLAGRLGLAEMQIELTRALAKHVDKLTDDLTTVAMITPLKPMTIKDEAPR